jgi:NAD(P)-dependent dehydrogenase (short-subunit alcohol dehydrogenase family)
MTSDPNLAGRRMVITGAGRGLGRALAITAADRGAELVLLGRNPPALQAVADAIRARTGRDSLTVPCDLARSDDVTEACRIVLAANPVVDVLVNNGAPWLPGGIMDIAETDIAATVAAAVTGTILVTRGLLPGLRRSAAGDIVTIVSTAGLLGWDIGEGSAAFYAAKHGQSGFTDRLRHELKEHGIRVAAIYPPDFDDTDALEPKQSAASGRLTSRDVVATVLFAIAAPRACAYPVIVLDNMRL